MRKLSLRVALVLLSLSATEAWAEPYFAAWKGVNCNACHMNQTGGWLRNDFGKNYGSTLETFDWAGISEAAQKIQHNAPSWVAVGLDLHEGYRATFRNNPNLDQDSFNTSKTLYPARQSFSIGIKANENISGVLTYRLDESGGVKEAYGLVSGLPEGAYLKLGKFMLPYGLTLSDDNSLVRYFLSPANNPGLFSFDNPVNDGVEAGIYPGPAFLNAAVVDGSSAFGTPTVPGYNEKIFSAKGGVGFHDFTLGGSLFGQDLDLSSRSMRYGAYGWGRLGPVVILAEYDGGYDDSGATPTGPVTASNSLQAYHGSLEVDLGQSMYLRVVSEYLNHSTPSGSSYDGFRHVLSFRCYPVRNLKFQLDLQRMDPTAGTPSAVNGSPDYAVVADAFVFY